MTGHNLPTYIVTPDLIRGLEPYGEGLAALDAGSNPA